ncbi:hypothetical protein GCM10027598_41190 [Amycolatopsis oliviviridis]|uniref:Uncharacterized protein n=1 Tax=Amycolatopsis oliviviridis TaxID=1471590 RepID=A0ABQ3LB71_9PSEU|nr:hypothetical protein GCM10017790_20650 [Amycolatopsis oliviviridis]
MGVGRILRIVDDDIRHFDAQSAGRREHSDQRFPECGEDMPQGRAGGRFRSRGHHRIKPIGQDGHPDSSQSDKPWSARPVYRSG